MGRSSGFRKKTGCAAILAEVGRLAGVSDHLTFERGVDRIIHDAQNDVILRNSTGFAIKTKLGTL